MPDHLLNRFRLQNNPNPKAKVQNLIIPAFATIPLSDYTNLGENFIFDFVVYIYGHKQCFLSLWRKKSVMSSA